MFVLFFWDRLYGHDTGILACWRVAVLVHISTGFRIECKAAELWVNYVVLTFGAAIRLDPVLGPGLVKVNGVSLSDSFRGTWRWPQLRKTVPFINVQAHSHSFLLLHCNVKWTHITLHWEQ